MLWDVLFYRNVIVLHHGEWKLYSVLTSVSNSHFLQYSQRWRNDKISLDVCYKTIKLFLREKNNSVIVKSRILYSNKTYFWAPDIQCNYDLFTILRSSHRMCFIKKCILENFPNFIGKQLCWSFFLIQLQEVSSFIKKRLRHRRFSEESTKFLRTPNLKTVNDCFWNLFFHLSCPF